MTSSNPLLCLLGSNVARQGPETPPFCFTYLPTHARMPADSPADAEKPLRRTTADAKNPQKMAADAFPAFEKYKVIESNPPCGCPMGCVAHCMGGRGFAAVSSPSLGDAFVLRSSLLLTCGFHASFQTCHALTLHQVSPPDLALPHSRFP